MGRAQGLQPADCEDALQDSSVYLIQKLNAGAEIENGLHLALHVAFNSLRNRSRRERRRLAIARRRLRPSAAPDPTLVGDQNLGPLMTAFTQLEPEDQTLLWLGDVRRDSDSEIASVLRLKPDAVRQRLVRARIRLAELYLKELLGNREVVASCRRPLSLFPRWWAGTLRSDQVRQLARHLVGCQSCEQTKHQLKKHRWGVGVRQLFPPPLPTSSEDRKQTAAGRLVAAIEPAPKGPWLFGPGRRRRLLAAPLLLLLLLILLTPPGRTLIGSAVPALARQSTPSYVSPCPPGSTGGYAYLDRGEVYYRSAIGSPAERITNTGGRVDDLWWTPDGRDLLYKVSASPPAIAGDVYMLDFGTRQQVWQLGAAAQFFALSSDGHSWAAGSISVQNGTNAGMDVMTGRFPQTAANPLSRFLSQVLGDPILYRPNDYEDRGFVPLAALGVGPLAWLSAGIYIDDEGTGIYSASGTYLAAGDLTPQLYDAAMGAPASSHFVLSRDRLLTRSCVGRQVLFSNALMQAGPTWMSVSPDGRTALLTGVSPAGAISVMRLYADGRASALSSDGATSLAEFRP